MEVRALSAIEDLKRYIDFGEEVYRENPYWVPPDAHHLIAMLGGQNPFGEQEQVQAFCVEEGERLLATITAVTDEAYDRHWSEKMGHLVLFEGLPDQEVAVELVVNEACEWLRTKGCQAARFSFLPGWQLPLTIDAYDAVPTIFHTYNPPCYHSYIKNAGFTTERGVVQYQVGFTPKLATQYKKMIARATDSGVKLRSFDFDRLEEDTETFTNLHNDAFRMHWGFPPLPAAVMRGLTVELKDFLNQDFMGLAEVDGQAVGFVYSLPDLNQALHKMRGKSLEDNLPEFQQYMDQIDHGVLLDIGVKEGYRGKGVNLALAAKSYLAMMERGYKTASYTVVLDDNWPSRRTGEKLGARVTRNFNVYRKELV